MGLDINAARFLVAARKQGAQFNRTAMLGRHNMMIFPQTVAELLENNGFSGASFKKAGPDCVFAEPFFMALGAQQVDSLDHSDFEGAKLIHDLNAPIPDEWKGQYDAVFDGGTLEHIFNFPLALKNSMELLREGGRLFIHNCANNLCGHGFYQFSPELFYRALSMENGFKVERMIIHRVGPYGGWWEVADPSVIRERVELITCTPMHIIVQACRVEKRAIFAQAPQQSDYTVRWSAEQPGSEPVVKPPRFERIGRLFSAVKTGINFYRRQSLGNRKFFRPVSKSENR